MFGYQKSGSNGQQIMCIDYAPAANTKGDLFWHGSTSTTGNENRRKQNIFDIGLNKVVITANNNSLTYNINGNTATYSVVSAFDPQADTGMWIFGNSREAAAGGHQEATAKFYYFRAYQNDELVADMIPAIDENGVGFIFDRVNHVAYLNAGTGSFLYGKKISNIKDRYLRDSQIPSIYKQVNYIQSTGTQYIDTGVYLTDNHSVEIDFQLTESPQHRTGIYGGLCNVNNVSSSDDYGRFGVLTHYQNNYFEGGYGKTNETSTLVNTGSQDLSRHTIKQEKNKIYFDGTLKKTFPTSTFTMGLTAYLGGFNYTNYTPSLAKYYGFKVWNDITLIRDFVPVIRKRDSKPGMYDKVNKVFYTNANSGVDFNYG